MILWFNCKITDIRVSNLGFNMRQGLRYEKRFDVARYTLASFVPWEPFISKILFNVELDKQSPDCIGREQEFEEWIYNLFPKEKIRLQWFRCDYPHQWEVIRQELAGIDDDIVYPVGNDDHLFVGNNNDMILKGIEYIRNDPDPAAMLTMAHFPEAVRIAMQRQGSLTPCGNFIKYADQLSINNFVMKKWLFERYVSCALKRPDVLQYKTDAISIDVPSTIYVPTKEISRHFDGYAHTGMDSNHCPPLEIPPGFFERNIIVKYCFDQKFENCLNINPMVSTLKAADPANGFDFRLMLEDMPLFWKDYIAKIDVAEIIDIQQVKQARNNHFIEIISAFHAGMRSNIPIEYIINHLYLI